MYYRMDHSIRDRVIVIGKNQEQKFSVTSVSIWINLQK